MLKHGLLITMVAVLLVATTVIGLAGCKSSRVYNKDTTFAANAFTSNKSISIILKKKANLATDIYNIQCAYDLEYGTDAHKNQNNLGRWETYLLEKLQEIITNEGWRIYIINKGGYEAAFEAIYKK
jgi:hypothetical protein